ncbi:TIGR00725 family protein [Candidatus Woesearchaeota archaeon]|nr:TIGR00725 family protein [Candidatus Woesearchaeota archaeon]MCF7900782.1 TIGR00725 family protein [Candidatus Woesearchaeota archaeon]MCF8013084.1 TIGR00725 family protein [Candidatus Woesearchaeota archaeon]
MAAKKQTNKINNTKNYDKLNYQKTKIGKTKRNIVIAVLGSSKSITTKKAYNYAYEVGQEIAKKGYVTLTGGGLGVMEAAHKGAKSKKGTTISIIPWEDMNRVNDYSDFVIATGIGWSRDAINLNSCDGAILVGGGAGTLNEATYAYMSSKPLVALTPSGGMAEELTNRFFDVRKTEYIFGANSPIQAVELILKLIKNEKLKKKKRLMKN